jgi:hypothetical protein
MPGFGQLKTLGIYTPPELRSLYGVTPTRFDSQGYLLLPLYPDNISFDDTYLGETGMVPTFTRLHYQGSRRVIRGYDITLIEGKVEIFYLVEALAAQSTGNPYIPVLIKDYVRPERADYALALTNQTEPCTARQGVILEAALTQGLVSSRAGDRSWAGEGFRFKFVEQIARSV